MAEFEKYTEAIYTAPETLHSNNNQRSQSKKTDLVDSNTNNAILSELLAPLASFDCSW